jgi:selenocysteine lyase/cysteine desulfurase
MEHVTLRLAAPADADRSSPWPTDALAGRRAPAGASGQRLERRQLRLSWRAPGLRGRAAVRAYLVHYNDQADVDRLVSRIAGLLTA